MRKWLCLFVSILFFGCMTTTAVAAGSDPVAMLRSLANQLIDGLKAHKTSLKTNPSLVYSLATKIIVPHANLMEMSKRVLPPSTWQQATPSQRESFQKEFTILLVRTYASALAEYNNQTIRFYPIRGGLDSKTNIKVDSQILRSDGPAISIQYKLMREGSQWKVYDISVEGISLLQSFRSQFADKLSRDNNIAGLIKDLKQHNAENSDQ